MEILRQFNKYQSNFNELSKGLPEEVIKDVISAIEDYKYIENLTSINRPRYEDLDKLDDGRIIVDLSNPHILEDMDYFRQAAIRFQKTGKYTDALKSNHKKSAWAQFWRKEAIKCLTYVVNPSNGEWIPGDYYFYLNYSPILRIKTDDHGQEVDRVIDFPDTYDGDYLYYHYLYKARHHSDKFIRGMHGGCIKARGRGFEQPNSEIVFTPDGKKKVGDINVGDYLINHLGNKTKVLEIFPQGKKDVYELTLADNRKVKCGLNHLWEVYNSKNNLQIVTTEYLLNSSLKTNKKNKNKNSYNYHIVQNKEVKFENINNELNISPYTLGALLGDGCSKKGELKISSDDYEIIERIIEENPDILVDKSKWDKYSYKLLSRKKGFNRLSRELDKLSLKNKKSYYKFIPEIYKYASIEDRWALVQGLMDTDGTSSKNGSVRFTNTSEKLIDDLMFVLRSLGIRVTKSKTKQGGKFVKFPNGYTSLQKDCWVLLITTDNKKIFHLNRKKENIKDRAYNINKTAIIDIKKLDYEEESTCFLVDNDRHLYITNDFVVTHNSFKGGAQLAKRYVLGDSLRAQKQVKAFALASEKEFLTKDGILNKFVDIVRHCADHTGWSKSNIKSSWNSMEWRSGYVTNDGFERGRRNEVLGVSMKDNSGKARGKRAQLILYEEFGKFPNFLDSWRTNRPSTEAGPVAFGQQVAFGCVCAGTKVWDEDGRLQNIEDMYLYNKNNIIGYDGKSIYTEDIEWLKEPTLKECYRIHTSGNNYIECSYDHPLLTTRSHDRKHNKGKKGYLGKNVTFTEASQLKIGDQLLLIDTVPIFGDKNIKDARLFGLMIGDGNCSVNATPQLSCGDDEIYEYIKKNYKTSVYKEFKQKSGKLFRSVGILNFIDALKDAGIYGKVSDNKTLPNNIHEYNKESLAELLGGYFDADGNVKYRKDQDRTIIVLTSKTESLLNEVKYQLIKFGIHSLIQKEFRKTGYSNNKYIYRLYISNRKDVKRFRDNITFLCNEKQSRLDKANTINDKDYKRITGCFKINPDNNKGKFFIGKDDLTNLYQETITEIEYIGEQPVYNMHTKYTNTYISNMYITKQTGGEEGSSFQGAEELIYHPIGYRVYGIPNVYDRSADGSTHSIFFSSEVLNMEGYYDKDGNSDVIGALFHIMNDRYTIKYNSSDPMALTGHIAEHPISIAEAIMRREGTLFPVVDLRDHLAELSLKYDDIQGAHYIGDLVFNKESNVEWRLNGDIKPIIKYPAKDNKEGAIEIFEMPKKNGRGEIDGWRYISGIDPVDNDEVTQSVSLCSIFIFDMLTDRIVAEYTGRPKFADDFYEICRRMLIFYNAKSNYENDKKGLYSYFNKKNSLHLLAPTPQILRDQELVRHIGYGNTAFGTGSSKVVNQWGRRLLRDWLLKSAYTQQYDNEGNQVGNRLNLHTIRGKATLEELIKWNPDGNFDRVSALGMVMIYREDRKKYIEQRSGEDSYKKKEDPYFSNNYMR